MLPPEDAIEQCISSDEQPCVLDRISMKWEHLQEREPADMWKGGNGIKYWRTSTEYRHVDYPNPTELICSTDLINDRTPIISPTPFYYHTCYYYFLLFPTWNLHQFAIRLDCTLLQLMDCSAMCMCYTRAKLKTCHANLYHNQVASLKSLALLYSQKRFVSTPIRQFTFALILNPL